MVLGLLWGVGSVRGWCTQGPAGPNPAARLERVMPIVDVSQHGEASVLATIVDDDWPRYLVDVGAHDGRSLSDSFPFLSPVWAGRAVKPLPAAFERLASLHGSRD